METIRTRTERITPIGRKLRPVRGKKKYQTGVRRVPWDMILTFAVLSHDDPPVIGGLFPTRAVATFNGIQRAPKYAQRKTGRTNATITTATG